jgi:hypothetical protein
LNERKAPGNPFRYGREADVLVDRIDELARVVRVGDERGTLFLIGPRRFGKTSILRAAEARLTEAGEKAERQTRAAVPRHREVGYVFAGSSSRMRTEMIATSNRAFRQLGDQMHLGPIPRPAFLDYLRPGFESAGVTIAGGALEALEHQ